jgi:cytidylate kinase
MSLLVGITGLARSGKDTVAKILVEELYKQTDRLFILMAYAHELKLKVQKDFGLSYEQLWGAEKEIEDKRYKRPFTYRGGVRADRDELPNIYWTPREIMQNYGQFYRTINYNFWVKHLFNIIERNNYKNVIITDVRYQNEAQPIVDSGGYVLRIIRDNKAEIHNQQHVSEIAMNNYDKIDFIIDNNRTLDELKLNVVDIVEQIVIGENNKKGDL